MVHKHYWQWEDAQVREMTLEQKEMSKERFLPPTDEEIKNELELREEDGDSTRRSNP